MAMINQIEDYMPPYLENKSFLDNRVGFYGTVVDVHPEDYTVDIIMDIGRKILNVPIASKSWVMEKSNGADSASSGLRDIPPIGSFVFCLMPTHTVTGAFVLCSAIPRGDAFSSNFMSSTDEEKADFPNIEKNVEVSGWSTEKRRDNGDIVIKDPKDEISLSIIHDKDDEKKDKVEIKVFGTSLNLERGDSGISVTLGNSDAETPVTLNVTGNVTASVEGDLSVEAKGSSGKTTVTTSGDTEISSSKNVKVNASGTLTIGNGSNTIGKFFGDLIAKIEGLQTFGSPANHAVMPSSITELETVKTQISTVFK